LIILAPAGHMRLISYHDEVRRAVGTFLDWYLGAHAAGLLAAAARAG
jgi:hypothetical protein